MSQVTPYPYPQQYYKITIPTSLLGLLNGCGDRSRSEVGIGNIAVGMGKGLLDSLRVREVGVVSY